MTDGENRCTSTIKGQLLAFQVAVVVIIIMMMMTLPNWLELICIAQDGLELMAILQPRPPACYNNLVLFLPIYSSGLRYHRTFGWPSPHPQPPGRIATILGLTVNAETRASPSSTPTRTGPQSLDTLGGAKHPSPQARTRVFVSSPRLRSSGHQGCRSLPRSSSAILTVDVPARSRSRARPETFRRTSHNARNLQLTNHRAEPRS